MKNFKLFSEELNLAESAAHIEQHLADKDINAKVVGNVVKVHSSDVAATKKHLKKAGYTEHKVESGLNEESEQIDELSKKTLANYAKKSHDQLMKHTATVNYKSGRRDDDAFAYEHDSDNMRKTANRTKGHTQAINKLAKEDVDQIDEISKDTLTSYVHKAFAHGNDLHYDLAHMRGNKATDAERKAVKDKISKRNTGIIKAVAKMKEDVNQIDEISDELANKVRSARVAASKNWRTNKTARANLSKSSKNFKAMLARDARKRRLNPDSPEVAKIKAAANAEYEYNKSRGWSNESFKHNLDHYAMDLDEERNPQRGVKVGHKVRSYDFPGMHDDHYIEGHVVGETPSSYHIKVNKVVRSGKEIPTPAHMAHVEAPKGRSIWTDAYAVHKIKDDKGEQVANKVDAPKGASKTFSKIRQKA